MKKNPDKSDTIGCSGVAVNISNRLRMLPETLPDVHLSNQLVESSEIGPFQDDGRGIKVKLGALSQSIHLAV